MGVHTCSPLRCTRVPARVSVYLRICIDSFLSVRHEFVTASHLSAVSLHILLVFPYPPNLSSFLRRVYRDPILLSPDILLSGDASKVTGARIPAARRRIPAGPIHSWDTLPTNPVASVETRTLIHTHTGAVVSPANYFCLASLKITSLQIRKRGQRNDSLSPDENYL